MPRRPRRRLALATVALLSVPALASCGFDYATDRVNTIGAGVTDRESDVDVLGVSAVADTDDRGNLVGALVNNSSEEDDQLLGVEGADDAGVVADFEPLDIPAGGSLNLSALIEDGEPITVTGTFGAGQFVAMTFTFANADDVTVDVPIKKACFAYEGLAPEPESDDVEPDGQGGNQDATDEPTDEADVELETEPEAAYACEQVEHSDEEH